MADEPLDAQEAESRDVAELLHVLDLEELDRDIYRGANPAADPRRTRLFGGQVAAQAARAASLTVPDDRLLHSLHGYFLRPGQADRPTLLHVDRDRDGRSYSARHVTARQDGKAIMSLLLSFTAEEQGHEFATPSIVASEPPPEAIDPADLRSIHHSIFDLRALGLGSATGAYRRTPHRYWARARGSLPDDRLLHACVLAYLSDVGTGLAKLEDEHPRGGPSLDHAVWFHRPARMDDWVFVELVPEAAAGGRAFYTGTVHDRDGRLLASIAQEHVSRDMGLG
jgi:acyl-CoA thioesterase II